MRKLLIVLLCIIGINLYAVDYTPFASQPMAPVATMHSVNNSGYMTTGSTYSASVYDVGADSPIAHSRGVGPRRVGGPGTPTGTSDYDPSNPQYSPIGDALIPLLLMAIVYAFVTMYKRRRYVRNLYHNRTIGWQGVDKC